MAGSPVRRLGPVAHLSMTVAATARADMKRHAAYVIDPVRAVVLPVLTYVSWWVAYEVSGQDEVAGVDATGFLLVGMLGLLTWSSALWSSGYAIEHERTEGTIDALFLTPANRLAVIVGYGLGSFVWFAPTLVILGIVAVATGARFDVSTPIVPATALAVLYLGSLCTGLAFAGLFVLSRRANLLANFLQLPVWLLAGFLAPRSALPEWMQPMSDAIPASHAIDALRASSLDGATFADVSTPLTWAVATSAVFALIGALGLKGVERAAKRTGTLEFH